MQILYGCCERLFNLCMKMHFARLPCRYKIYLLSSARGAAFLLFDPVHHHNEVVTWWLSGITAAPISSDKNLPRSRLLELRWHYSYVHMCVERTLVRVCWRAPELIRTATLSHRMKKNPSEDILMQLPPEGPWDYHFRVKIRIKMELRFGTGLKLFEWLLLHPRIGSSLQVIVVGGLQSCNFVLNKHEMLCFSWFCVRLKYIISCRDLLPLNPRTAILLLFQG